MNGLKLKEEDIRNALLSMEVPAITADLFIAYHKKKPDVWRNFEKYSLKVWEAGKRRFGAKAVMERIRWEVEIETRTGEFKVANSFVAYYARVFMIKYPEANDVEFFELAEIKGLRKECPETP